MLLKPCAGCAFSAKLWALCYHQKNGLLVPITTISALTNMTGNYVVVTG